MGVGQYGCMCQGEKEFQREKTLATSSVGPHTRRESHSHKKGALGGENGALVLSSQRSTKLGLRKPGPKQDLGEHLQSSFPPP